jgi:cell division protein FtsA
MSKEHYIVGLDVGSSHIRVVQAKLDPEVGRLSIVGASEVPSFGIRKGVIVDIEEAVSCISQALERVERMTGLPVSSANVSVSGSHISSLSSHGVIAVSRADGEISESDVVRVIDASQAISIPQNREVIHVFPKTFTLDGQTGIKDPLGMSGIRLEVETIIVQAGLPFMKNLTKAIMQAGLDIQELVLAPCAAAESILTKRQKDLGVALIDLGAGTTGIAVYEEGDLLHTQILPVGCMHITNDIAIGLRCAIDTAEKVKLMYGHSDPKAVDPEQEIDLHKLDPSEEETVYRKEVAEIIEARLEEIFDLVTKELKKIQRDGKLPAGIVLTGGGSHMPGLVDFVKKHLKLPVTIGQPQNVETIVDRVDDASFATATGLVLWGDKFSSGSSGNGFSGLTKGLMQHEGVEKLRKWLRSFLP